MSDVNREAFDRYMKLSQEIEDELIAEMGQEAYDASQHWINNPLIKPVSKVHMFEEALKHEGDDGYREGIAWERKRVEMAWHEEMACQCSNFEYHLLERIEEK
jgi:hypothetical protein